MWPSRVPELATPRLRLREPGGDDAPGLLGLLEDPEVTRYHNMPTLTTEEGIRRDYLYFRDRFHDFRWFSLLETDERGGARA